MLVIAILAVVQTSDPTGRHSADGLLRLLHIEARLAGIAFLAFAAACFSFFLLGAQGPARIVGLVILAVSVAVIAVCVVGWIVTDRKEDQIAERIGHADITSLMDGQRWGDAITRLEVLQASPDAETRIDAWNLLAQCYAATERNAESEALIRRSIEAQGAGNETVGTQLACLGAVVRRQGRTDEAEEIYARALDGLRGRDPEATVFTLRNVAYLYWTAGDEEKAREIYADMPECDTQQLHFLTDALKPFAEPELPVD